MNQIGWMRGKDFEEDFHNTGLYCDVVILETQEVRDSKDKEQHAIWDKQREAREKEKKDKGLKIREEVVKTKDGKELEIKEQDVKAEEGDSRKRTIIHYFKKKQDVNAEESEDQGHMRKRVKLDHKGV